MVKKRRFVKNVDSAITFDPYLYESNVTETTPNGDVGIIINNVPASQRWDIAVRNGDGVFRITDNSAGNVDALTIEPATQHILVDNIRVQNPSAFIDIGQQFPDRIFMQGEEAFIDLRSNANAALRVNRLSSGVTAFSINCDTFVTFASKLQLETTGGTRSSLDYYEFYQANVPVTDDLGNDFFTSPVSCQVRVERIGRTVTLTTLQVFGTNATNTRAELTDALPSRFAPTNNTVQVTHLQFYSAADQLGRAEITVGGSILFFPDVARNPYPGSGSVTIGRLVASWVV